MEDTNLLGFLFSSLPLFHPSSFLPTFPSSNLLCLVDLIQKVGNFIFTQKKVIVPFPLLLFCLE